MLKILIPKDIDNAYEFAHDLSLAGGSSESGPNFDSWNASWRKESLSHYAELGWSLAEWNSEESKVVGLCLAQPLLYFAEHTQVLWVECVLSRDTEVARRLLESVIRFAKDKHLQRVLCPKQYLTGEMSGLGFQEEGWNFMASKTVK